jgi:hypothetical protein
MFLLFSFLESIKNAEPYLPVFQSSADGSQAGAADLVQRWLWSVLDVCAWRTFSPNLLMLTRLGLVKGR